MTPARLAQSAPNRFSTVQQSPGRHRSGRSRVFGSTAFTTTLVTVGVLIFSVFFPVLPAPSAPPPEGSVAERPAQSVADSIFAALANAIREGQPVSEIEGQAKAQRLQKIRSAQAVLAGIQTNQGDFDATYFGINIRIDFGAKVIYGIVKLSFRSLVASLTQVDIDFYDNMIIDSINQQGVQLTYTRGANLVRVTLARAYSLGEEFTVEFFYHGTPVTGGFQAWSFSTHNGFPAASTLSEPYFGRTWWPSKDHPSDKADSADINIAAPSSYVVSSNGKLRQVIDNGDGTQTWFWHEGYPITTYLVAVAATNYARFSRWYKYSPTDSMEVQFYPYPEDSLAAETYWTAVVPMIGYLAALFGEYPFLSEKYAMTQFDWGGGMEHQTNTYIIGFFPWEAGAVHELGHQWWGDLVTCQNWHDIWLNEGFATYCEALWFGRNGFLDYKSYMNQISYRSGGTIYVQDTTNVNNIFAPIVYRKGAWALHMLRHVVGDSTFFQILRQFAIDYAHSVATTAQFRQLCEALSGKDLTAFFQQWIYGTYFPTYQYSWTWLPSGDSFAVYLHINQVQTTNPQVFKMPVDIAIFKAVGFNTYVVYDTARSQDFRLVVPEQPTLLQFDRDNWILKDSSQVVYTQTLPGDLDNNKQIDLTDIVRLINYVFFDITPPSPMNLGDVNGDCRIDITDNVFLINFVFLNGEAPYFGCVQ